MSKKMKILCILMIDCVGHICKSCFYYGLWREIKTFIIMHELKARKDPISIPILAFLSFPFPSAFG